MDHDEQEEVSFDEEYFDADLLVRNFEKEAELVLNGILPEKSKKLYLKAYDDFMKWRSDNSATTFDECVFLVYFQELSEKFKPPTLWSIWSKLKLTLSINGKVNLDKYANMKALLSNKHKGYKPKKSKTFTVAQVNKFLELADDTIYLAIKAILIIGFFGCLRCQEIVKLKLVNIEDYDDHFVININETKTDICRNFMVSQEYYNIIKKYQSLRPADLQDSDRFFINYQKGKCVRQFIGKNKISAVPNTIAIFLQLPDPEKYTGHCFRRSSATALSHAGANLSMVKFHGGWKSDAVAQGYIDFSIASRKQVFDLIAESGKRKTNHFMNHPPINNVLSRAKKNLLEELIHEPSTSKHSSNTTDYSDMNYQIGEVSSHEATIHNQSAELSPHQIIRNQNVKVLMNKVPKSAFEKSESNSALLTSNHQKNAHENYFHNHNRSSVNRVQFGKENECETNISEPSSKKVKSALIQDAVDEMDPKTVFQRCDIQSIIINYNKYYSCSCKDK